MEPAIRFDGVGFAYNGKPLFAGFDLELAAGSVTAVLGPSGVGKSTLARLLAGDAQPLAGQVVRSSAVAAPSDVMYVDQDPMNSVFPWQTVEENLEYPLRVLGWTTTQRRERVDHLVAQFRLTKRLAALPAQLSGGELQRLALARTLSWRPRLVVMDETLAALDRPLREDALSSLRAIAAGDGTTLVLITHSIPDAINVATRCLVLGRRPARIVLDLPITAEFPRDEHAPGIQHAQQALLEGLRDGLLD